MTLVDVENQQTVSPEKKMNFLQCYKASTNSYTISKTSYTLSDTILQDISNPLKTYNDARSHPNPGLACECLSNTQQWHPQSHHEHLSCATVPSAHTDGWCSQVSAIQDHGHQEPSCSEGDCPRSCFLEDRCKAYEIGDKVCHLFEHQAYMAE